MTVMPHHTACAVDRRCGRGGIGRGSTIGAKVGGWFTGRTVTVKVWKTVLMPPLAVPPLSLTVTVIVAVPKVLATGVKVSEPDWLAW